MWLILIFYSCVPFDVVLPESELMLGCFQCSKETSVKVIINDQSLKIRTLKTTWTSCPWLYCWRYTRWSFFFKQMCHWNCVIYCVQGLQYGANWSWCGHCHHKLRFQIESTRFHQLQSSALDTSGWLTIFVFCSNKTIRSLVLNVSHYMHNFLCHSIHYRPIHEFKLVCKLMYFLEHSGSIVPEHFWY